MKKEIIAVLLLVLLFVLTLVNIQVVDRLTGTLLDMLDTAELDIQNENLDAAAQKAQAAAELWLQADAYTHIFIRHSEIDSTTDAFYELLIQLQSGESGGALGALSLLRAHLTSIAGMEHISLGSVL